MSANPSPSTAQSTSPPSTSSSGAPSSLSSHRVWKLGANIDTDALAPGHAMKFGMDVVARHCLESVRPEFAQAVRPGDVLVAGHGFGVGSSREQAASVLVQLGVKAVIAPSFSGLYFRNAFNLGLLLLTCADAASIAEGEAVQIVHDEGRMVLVRADGTRLACEPIPDFLMTMVQCGGLMNQLLARYGKTPILDTPNDAPSGPQPHAIPSPSDQPAA